MVDTIEKAAMMILGFLLSTVLGGVIGYLLKRRSWAFEASHALHRARYDEGRAFLDRLSRQVGRRYFLLHRYFWAIQDGGAGNIEACERKYYAAVVDWNCAYWSNRNNIRLLIDEAHANLFLDYRDDQREDHPQSLHYRFVAAHRAVRDAKLSASAHSDASHELHALNWACSVFLERLTGEFLNRASRLQLLEAPAGPGAAEQAAPATAKPWPASHDPVSESPRKQ